MKLLLLLIIIIPFQFFFDIYGDYTGSLAQLIAVVLILLAASGHKKIRTAITADTIAGSVAVLILIMLVSSVCSDDIRTAAIHMIKWSIFILVYFPVMMIVDTKEKLRNALLVMLIPAAILSAMAIWQYTYSSEEMFNIISRHKGLFSMIMEPSTLAHKIKEHGFNWYRPDVNIRAFGSFMSANNFSQYIGLVLPLLAGLLLSSGKKPLNAVILPFVFLLAAVNILTFSRGGLLGMSGVLIFGLMLIIRKRGWKYLWIALVAFLIIFLSGVILKPVRTKAVNRFDKTENSVVWRCELWSGAMDVIRKKPFLGTGPGNYDLFLDREMYEGPAHSNYLQTSAEFGIPGLAAFMAVILMAFMGSYRVYLSRDRFLKSLGAAFCMLWVWFAIQSLFTSYLFGIKFGMMFWTVLGLNSALIRIKEAAGGDDIPR
ncbi:MAG: O-antigen ligase family protein [Elusimicrobia bacterium]|nr:O-antigen ligase family protein [Elusimicrobiota bacterium]